MNIAATLTSKSNEYGTPQKTYDDLNLEFGFTLDPCATNENAKCKMFYTIDDDGLSKDWSGHTVFCNPPYGREIGKWVAKASTECKKHKTLVVMLIPARTDTKYFHEYIYNQHEIRFIKGRLKFEKEGIKQGAPFPSMIVIMK